MEAPAAAEGRPGQGRAAAPLWEAGLDTPAPARPFLRGRGNPPSRSALPAPGGVFHGNRCWNSTKIRASESSSPPAPASPLPPNRLAEQKPAAWELRDRLPMERVRVWSRVLQSTEELEGCEQGHGRPARAGSLGAWEELLRQRVALLRPVGAFTAIGTCLSRAKRASQQAGGEKSISSQCGRSKRIQTRRHLRCSFVEREKRVHCTSFALQGGGPGDGGGAETG